jgi:hypothetical protein
MKTLFEAGMECREQGSVFPIYLTFRLILNGLCSVFSMVAEMILYNPWENQNFGRDCRGRPARN